MYRFHHIKPTKRFLAFFTSTYPKQSFHHNALLRCLSFKHSSHVSHSFICSKVLPPELSRNVVRLTCKSSANGGVCDVYLIGTIHQTPESCLEVKALVNFVKPQVVFLELCSDRAYVLEPVEVVITEFQVAYEEAKKYGAKVILGDRPVEVSYFTLSRCSQILVEIFADERDQYMSAGLLEVVSCTQA